VSDSLRLLIVDEDEADRTAVRRALAHVGLEGTWDEVADASSARDRIGRESYDCVILDHTLPDSNGAELVRALRADGLMMPILVVTGQQDEELEQVLAESGATDFMPKTELSPARLARRLRFAIRVGKAESESARALADARAAARARDTMLAVVSHDLRGPLNAIGLACEALRDETPESARRYLAAIERATSRAERLIRDLLEVSRIEAGGLELAPRAVDGRGLVTQACSDHELIAGENGTRFEVMTPQQPVPVLADRDRVLQVFGNLIGNAVKYGRGAPIEVSLSERDGAAVFAVADRGPGIPADQLPHVFDRFWQGRQTRSGAGLGLAIAKGIVDAHRGTIVVQSEPGKGARFEFTLPRP
jgi:signal transduction histidine kinase